MSPTANDLKRIYAALHGNGGCTSAAELASATGLELGLIETGLKMLAQMSLVKNDQGRVEDIQFRTT